MGRYKDQCKLTGLVLACGIVLFASVRVKITVAAQGVSRPAQWEATLEAAKKEGKVNIYMYGYGKAAAPSRCRAGSAPERGESVHQLVSLA